MLAEILLKMTNNLTILLQYWSNRSISAFSSNQNSTLSSIASRMHAFLHTFFMYTTIFYHIRFPARHSTPIFFFGVVFWCWNFLLASIQASNRHLRKLSMPQIKRGSMDQICDAFFMPGLMSSKIMWGIDKFWHFFNAYIDAFEKNGRHQSYMTRPKKHNDA